MELGMIMIMVAMIVEIQCPIEKSDKMCFGNFSDTNRILMTVFIIQ